MWWRIMFALMMCKSYFDCCWWSASPRFRRPRFRTRLLASPRKPAEACRDSIQRHRRRSTVWCSRAMWTMLYLYHPATRACHIWFHHKPTVACFSVCFPRRKKWEKKKHENIELRSAWPLPVTKTTLMLLLSTRPLMQIIMTAKFSTKIFRWNSSR